MNVKHRLTRLERWNGSYYEQVAMADLGLSIQLGHPLDLECVNPEAAHKSFTVIHTNGIHMVNAQFCNCEHRVSHRVQILRANWWPASVHYPRTCATMEVLKTYHGLTLSGKISCWEYYQSLERMTDNRGIRVPNVSSSVLRYHLKISSPDDSDQI